MNGFITAIEDGKEDNYYGVLSSYVSYEGLRNVLLNKGFSLTDHKVQTIGHIFTVMNDPDSTVYPEHATNDVLYHTIKDFPIMEEDKKLNTHERREMTLLEFLKKEYDYAVTDGCKDMRESVWPDRQSLWVELSKSNSKDFKQGATKDLIDKFFNKQHYVSYSNNKKMN